MSLPPVYICIYNELWEILCISPKFSASFFPPQLFPPMRRSPSACSVIAESFWGVQQGSTTPRFFLTFRQLLHGKVCLSCLLQNKWERTNSVQPVKAESKSDFASAPATYYFDRISPMHIWNLLYCKPDVLFGLVSPLYKKINAPLWSL